MKKNQKLYCASLLIGIVCLNLSSCHKSVDAEPENVLTLFVGLLFDNPSAYTSISYSSSQKISMVNGTLGNGWVHRFKYDSANQLINIELSSTDFHPSELLEYKINYSNGLPVSGTKKYMRTASITSPQEYTVDSALIKVQNGKVTRITYFDSKDYDFLTKKLLRARTDTTQNCVFTYNGNDMVRVNTNRGPRDYTYGTNKGVGSAYGFKFLLYPEVDPIFYSGHEILTEIKWKDTPSQDKTEYMYEYIGGGYPKSGMISKSVGYGPPQYFRTVQYSYK